MSDTDTSVPGPGSDPLEPDFEKQLQEEGFNLEGREKPVEPAKPDAPAPTKEPASKDDKPADDGKKPDEGKPEDGKKPEDGAKPKEEPAKGTEEWRVMIAKRRQEKAHAGGKEGDKPAEPAKPADPSKPESEKPAAPTAPELTEEQKALADKYGIEHEDFLKMFPSPKVEEKVVKEGLSPEQQQLLDTIRAERDELLIDKGYNTDFDTNVLPLLKAEYPTISEAKIAEVRKTIREKLETGKYGDTPLDVLYNGDKSFRGLVPKKEPGADEGSRVPARGNSGKVYDFEHVTEEDVKNPDFPFEEYSDFMAKKESNVVRS